MARGSFVRAETGDNASDQGALRIAEFETRLAEAEDALAAIRAGEVDAVLVGAGRDTQVYTLDGAERVYRLLIEQMREGAAVVAADGTLLYANAAFHAINPCGGAVVGGRLADLFEEGEGRTLARLLVEGGREDLSWTCAGGEAIPVRVSAGFVDLPDGRLTCIVLTNLSEERAHAAQLAAAAAQLAQSQKMETVGQLTGGVAHDFNNLLTPIMGNFDILSRMHSDERSQRLIGNGLAAAERAKILVQRLLAFSRRQMLLSRALDMRELVEGMTDLIARTIGPAIRVELVIAGDLPPAQADPNQLELALLNLAVNARDAMPDGGVLTIGVDRATIDVDRRGGLPQGEYLRVVVADTGHGMDTATLARAVEPFYSTKEVGKGTGLGLSMVHGLAEQSGGMLGLESAPGEGTRATLWLPVAAAPAEGQSVSGVAALITLEPLDILLVDDDEAVRTATVAMLGEAKHRVSAFADARPALEFLRGGSACDVLVTDYLMPGLRGDALAEAARALRPGLPVLLATGFTGPAPAKSPGIARIEKPYRANALTAALGELTRAV